VNQIEQDLELELRQERVQRALLAAHDAKDWASLLAMAERLNVAWHNEATKAKWFAKEAASNLTRGCQTGPQLPNLHDSPDR
jgi:hypothetical protein